MVNRSTTCLLRFTNWPGMVDRCPRSKSQIWSSSGFISRYTRDGENYKPLTDLRRSAQLSIARYLESYPSTTRFVLEAEKPFEFIDRDTGALIGGTVDLIQRIEPTSREEEGRVPVAIVDFKAHRWGNLSSFLTRKKEVESQLRLYSVAVGHSLGFDAKEAYAHFLSPRPPSRDLIEQGVQERVAIDVSEESQQRRYVR